MHRAAEFAGKHPGGGDGRDAGLQGLRPQILHSLRAVGVTRVADAADRMTPLPAEGRDAVAQLRRVVPRLVRPLFLHPAKVEGQIAKPALQRGRPEQLELRRQQVPLVVARAEMQRRQEIVIVEPQLLRLGPRHRLPFRRRETSIPIARLFQGNVMAMHPATGIKGLASGIGDDMDLPVTADLGANPGLPVHQFVSEFADKRSGHQDASGKKTKAERAERAGDFIAEGKWVRRGARRFLEIGIGHVYDPGILGRLLK